MDPEAISEIDRILSKILTEIGDLEEEREKELISYGLPIKYEIEEKVEE